jgi:glutathione S-transferase
MITVYHLENSRSERIIWLLEELGLPYELQRFPRDQNMMAGEAYRALHPVGKSPIVRDGEILIESGAIVEYIINRHAHGRLGVPVDSPLYARYLQWMHFAEGSAMAQILTYILMCGFIPGIDQSLPFVAYTREKTVQLLSYLDGELDGSSYFLGADFSAADIMMTYCFTTCRSFLHMDLSPYQNITKYLDRIARRPAYQKATVIANRTASARGD